MWRQGEYEAFRRMYPEFIYDSYKYDVQPEGLHITFCFRIVMRAESGEGRTENENDIVFEPSAVVETRDFLDASHLSKETLDTLVFNIGMAELVSYWKCYCPPLVRIRPFGMDDRQVAFWKKLYYNGLGEFFYTNNIEASEEDFMTIRCEDGERRTESGERRAERLFRTGGVCDSHIVPIGGGKDSVVTLELLSEQWVDRPLRERPLPLIMNPRGATIECVKAAGYTMDDVIVIRRSIHPKLLELNKQGALNGHTPFSAMLAFYTLLASAMTGSRPDIALSNENSANESTVAGTKVNHQYSKSLEFENDFRVYVKEYVSTELNYYSFLRPLSELQIAMLFARYDKYHPVFRSCNVGSKEDVWCGHCAKCLFAYIILSPFIEPERLSCIFGKNMLDDESMRHEFDQLTGNAETKPFECVGTVSEVNSALSMCIAKWYPGERPALLKGYVQRPVSARLDSLTWGTGNGEREEERGYDSERPLSLGYVPNNLPKSDFEILLGHICYSEGASADRGMSSGKYAEQFYRYDSLFNLLCGKEILIAGYGREGKSSEALLKKLFPRRSYDVSNNNEELIELLKTKRYDLILKSPGIPNFVIEDYCEMSRVSSQTDIFLRVYGDITVGISGTKGKSTTTSLIHHVLRESYGDKNVVLAGNIDIPLFDIIPSLNDRSIVVAELSCHQLENIHRAPHISVLLNLFEEHLDHYRDYSGYCDAKMQIAKKQSENDVFFYCGDNADLRHEVEKYRDAIVSRKHKYGLSEAKALKPLQEMALPLIGDHNFSNIYVTWLVAEEMGVPFDCFKEALMTFKGLEHRLERVDSVGGVTYYNDSISTIPQATIAAVDALQKVDTLILGGFSRGIDYEPLAEYLLRNPVGKRVRNIVLFGSAGREIERAMSTEDAGYGDGRHIMCHFDTDYSMKRAVEFAAQYTEEGCICLLSPAASSYDHYKNFEERGKEFKECVEKRRCEM